MTMDLSQRLARIRLVSLDVDGVQTDGGLYYTESGEEMRRYHVRDGMGIKRLMAAGIEIAIISQSTTPAILHRARKLGVSHCLVGVEDKLGAMHEICASRGISLDQVAHMADDVNDLPLLRAVGLPVAVADAVLEVLACAAHVTRRNGGEGAVREFCELLLASRAAAHGHAT